MTLPSGESAGRRRSASWCARSARRTVPTWWLLRVGSLLADSRLDAWLAGDGPLGGRAQMGGLAPPSQGGADRPGGDLVCSWLAGVAAARRRSCLQTSHRAADSP